MTSFAVVAGVAGVVQVAGVAGVVVDGAFCMSVSSPGRLVVAGVAAVVEIAGVAVGGGVLGVKPNGSVFAFVCIVGW